MISSNIIYGITDIDKNLVFLMRMNINIGRTHTCSDILEPIIRKIRISEVKMLLL